MSPAVSRVTLEVDVPEAWVEYVTHYGDLFGRPYHCGYWAFGAYRAPKRGWLVFEHDDERPDPHVIDEVVEVWLEGGKLPAKFYVWDRALAIKAWGIGVRRYGEEWWSGGDGPREDVVMQLATLGEIRYG